ncbi:hypothetical protein SESBI_42404 [Sesbania bispinosa]|nr:hypothetical protein SESBI_42404 [Sesbania bispinosa]
MVLPLLMSLSKAIFQLKAHKYNLHKNGALGSDAGQGGIMQQLDKLISNVIKTMSQEESPVNDSNRDMGHGS